MVTIMFVDLLDVGGSREWQELRMTSRPLVWRLVDVVLISQGSKYRVKYKCVGHQGEYLFENSRQMHVSD